MKKNIVRALALVLVVALCAVCFTACVPADFSKAKANLEGNGYVVALVENGKIANAANLEAIATAEVLGVKLTGTCTQVIHATSKDNPEDSVIVYYFDNGKDASAFNKAVKEQKKETKAELKKAKDAGDITEEEYKEILEEMKNSKFGAMGKAFYSGTKAAVKACN